MAWRSAGHHNPSLIPSLIPSLQVPKSSMARSNINHYHTANIAWQLKAGPGHRPRAIPAGWLLTDNLSDAVALHGDVACLTR